MAAYRLYTVVPRLVKFVDNLTNWYVRMNRKRLKVRDLPRLTGHRPRLVLRCALVVRG